MISNQDGAIGFNVTDGTGTYTQDLIPLGPFTIDAFEAANAGHGAATGQIFVAGQDVPVDITEDALAVVTGHVVEVGTLAPLKGWRVSFGQQTRSGRSISLMTTSSVDGGFSFPGAAVGAFTLLAHEAETFRAGAGAGRNHPGRASGRCAARRHDHEAVVRTD